MAEEIFSPKESLQLIDSMINKAQRRFSENGFLYLLWGWIIFACSIAHFVLIQLQWFKHPEIIWASCWVAVIFQIIYLSKNRKKEKVKTYSTEIIDYIWISFGISMFIISFTLGRANGWIYLYIFIRSGNAVYAIKGWRNNLLEPVHIINIYTALIQFIITGGGGICCMDHSRLSAAEKI